MSGPLKVQCPHCGSKYRVERQYAYRTFRCGSCARRFLLPRAVPVPSDESVSSATEPAARLPRIAKMVLSVWILFHFAGIVVAAASVAPSSNLAQSGWTVFRPYLQLLYLNHGYRFFAPNPGPSTLLGWTLEFADGHAEQGEIPHRTIWPRLYYHRHFMLTEFLNFAPPDWHKSYARHLCHTTGAAKVTLVRRVHFVPDMEAVRNGRKLVAPESYQETPLGSFRCDEL